MNAKETYLSGKAIFIISLIVIGLTILTVYLTGASYNRLLLSNFYLSLCIIGVCLFMFMTFGLYKGIGVIDDFPKYKDFKSGDIIAQSGEIPSIEVEVGDGLGDIVLSIVFWIGMTIFILISLMLLEVILWFSFFIILMMLYWIFFRALRLVFNRSNETKENLGLSISYSLGYTILFTGWLLGIAYLIEIFN